MATVTADRARALTLTATCLGFAVVTLDVSVVNVAVNTIGRELGGGVSGLQWVVNAYTIGFAAFILTAGALGDRIGARRVFVGGFALFMVSSCVCGVAPSLGVLIAARAVQGVAAAVIVPSSLSLLNHAHPDPRERGRAVGLWHAGGSVALAAGPLVGGVLIAAAGWRAIFFINVPVALAGIALTLRYAAETTQSRHRGIDGVGQLLAVAALAVLVGATIEGGVSGFGAPAVLGGFALALAGLAAFIAAEARGRRPMLPLSLFRSRIVSTCVGMGMLANASFYGLIFVLSLFFQREQHRSPLATGLALLPTAVGILLVNLAAGSVIARIGPRRSILIGGALAAAADLALIGTGSHTAYAAMVVQLTAAGVGNGLVVPPITYVLLSSVDRTRSGVAAGTLNTVRQTGSAIGVALFGAVLGGGFVAGLHVALAIGAGLTAAIALLSPLLAAG